MKFTHWLGAIFMGSGIGILAFSFALEHNLLFGRYQALSILSGSMHPRIRVGSAVITKSYPNYRQGEIISFSSSSSPSGLITHRIIAKTFPTGSLSDPVFLTSGDSNEDIDVQSVTLGDIKGKVILTIPYLGRLAVFSQTPNGFILLIVAPASIIIYEEFKNIVSQIKKTKKGDNEKSSIAIVPFFGLSLLLVFSQSASFLSDLDSTAQNVLGAWESDEKVDVYFDPNQTETNPNANLNIFINPNGSGISFARVVILFDQTKLNLSSVNPTATLATEIETTDLTVANSTGELIIVRGLAVSDPAPTNTFAFANLEFVPANTSVNQTTDLTFDQTDMEIVKMSSATPLPINTTDATILVNPSPIINEFLPNPGSLYSNEWVELYNPTLNPIDLTGWALSDKSQLPKSISQLGVIPAGGFAVFEGPSEGWLNNSSSDTIKLINSNNIIKDEHTYTSALDDISIGRSTDSSSNWQTCLQVSKGTTNNNYCQ